MSTKRETESPEINSPTTDEKSTLKCALKNSRVLSAIAIALIAFFVITAIYNCVLGGGSSVSVLTGGSLVLFSLFLGIICSKKKSPIETFAIMVGVSFVLYIIYYIACEDAGFVDVFMLRTGDLFMDFFNSVRDAAQGVGVYTERHVIYPPMANLIYLIFSRFIPSKYHDTPFYSRMDWMEYTAAIFFICLFTFLLLLILYILFQEFTKADKRQRIAFAFFAIFNIPVLYMIERGNMILFCFISLILYAFTYNSDKKLYREIGLLALAFAFSLKLYPAVFGFVLLVDKRFKEALRCAIYGLLMLIIPSFFFGGPSCFLQILTNITAFSTKRGNSSVDTISNFLRIPPELCTVLIYIWVAICAACFVLSPFVHKERWKYWTMGLCTLLVLPSLTAIYLWAFMLIPILMLSNSGKFSTKDKIYFFAMAAVFVFSVARLNRVHTINAAMVFPSAAFLSIFAVADTLICGVKKYKAHKLQTATQA